MVNAQARGLFKHWPITYVLTSLTSWLKEHEEASEERREMYSTQQPSPVDNLYNNERIPGKCEPTQTLGLEDFQ